MKFKIGQRVKYSYLAGAISCEWNGREISGDGEIIEFEDDIWVIISRWDGDDFPVRVRRSEITHVKWLWWWRKVKHV